MPFALLGLLPAISLAITTVLISLAAVLEPRSILYATMVTAVVSILAGVAACSALRTRPSTLCFIVAEMLLALYLFALAFFGLKNQAAPVGIVTSMVLAIIFLIYGMIFADTNKTVEKESSNV